MERENRIPLIDRDVSRKDPIPGSIPGNLNLRVTEAERWSFKAWCAANHFTLLEGFRKSLAVFQMIHGAYPDLSGKDAVSLLDQVDMVPMSATLRLERRGEPRTKTWTLVIHSDAGAGVARHIVFQDPLTSAIFVIPEPPPEVRNTRYREATELALPDALSLARAYLHDPGQATTLGMLPKGTPSNPA